MPDDYREHMYESATAEGNRFISAHPDFTLGIPHGGVAWQREGGGTNFVLWGDHGDEPVIYKFFHPDWGVPRYRNELACLHYFAPTGRVPEVHATVPEALIVMSCLPGHFINTEVVSDDLDDKARAHLSRELGQAVGQMVSLPLPEEGSGYSIVRDYDVIPWNTDLRKAIEFYLELCRRDQHSVPTGADPFYDESLSLVEGQLDQIACQRQLVWHEDFHCFADRGRLSGIFDLEMARLGTDLMQLERVFGQCEPGGLNWGHVLEGYQEETRRRVCEEDYVFMLAAGLFYFHIRITRWGTPNTRADYVAQYLPDMREVARAYVDYVDLGEYLPSL